MRNLVLYSPIEEFETGVPQGNVSGLILYVFTLLVCLEYKVTVDISGILRNNAYKSLDNQIIVLIVLVLVSGNDFDTLDPSL